MKHFEFVKEYKYPSGSVYVLYNKEKNFYIETTSMQDVNTRGVPPQDVLSWGPYYYDKESDEISKLNNIMLNELFA